MSKLIAIRHGQSTWNAENRFTGWVDVDLSEKGVREAEKSGKLLQELNLNFNIAYLSIYGRLFYNYLYTARFFLHSYTYNSTVH